MLWSEKVLSRRDLPNGLTLEIWDVSRQAAGDRWQVVVEIRVAVPVTADNLPPELKEQVAEVQAGLGLSARFTKQEVRNFVAEGEVAGLLDKIQAELLDSTQAYLGHPQFAPRFLRKRYLEIQEHRKRYPDDQTGKP